MSPDIEPSTAKQELASASKGAERWSPMLRKPTLTLRGWLIQFAVENDLADEGEALLVVAARYFRAADPERFSGWLGEPRDGS